MKHYDATQSYLWNYENPPRVSDVPTPPAVPGEWTFCGLRVSSPLGIAAGPLLNGRWVLYYAELGFDVLTYKTVRSHQRDCYPLPNLVPVSADVLTGDESEVTTTEQMKHSWAVAFGMPSKEPKTWQDDVTWTRSKLASEKKLSVSVVASPEPDWSLDKLANDYAQCARWAIDSGADAVETNFSCPNVSSRDGQLYQQPEAAAIVAHAVRDAIGDRPYCVKIGHVKTHEQTAKLLDALAPHATAMAMTNSIATQVRMPDGTFLFEGQKRGICGQATRDASIAQVDRFAQAIKERGLNTGVVGVGGASTANDVHRYLAAGAECVHIATAAMIDPMAGLRIREELSLPENLREPKPGN